MRTVSPFRLFASRLLRATAVGAVLVSTAFSSGCMTGRGPLETCIAGVRNRELAKNAWLKRRNCYGGVQNALSDFSRGFCDGYCAAIDGRDRVAPAIAPKRYHGLLYNSIHGQECAMSWHDGWEHGKVAAEQDGVAGLSTVMLRCPCEPCEGGPQVDPFAEYSPYAQPIAPTHSLQPPPSNPAFSPAVTQPVVPAVPPALLPTVEPEDEADEESAEDAAESTDEAGEKDSPSMLEKALEELNDAKTPPPPADLDDTIDPAPGPAAVDPLSTDPVDGEKPAAPLPPAMPRIGRTPLPGPAANLGPGAIIGIGEL